jgi:phospholipase C
LVFRWQKAAAGAMALGFIGASVTAAAGPVGANKPPADTSTTTPVKHLVVIFQENVSFDHYFGTYPNATNASGQPFYPSKKTPTVNGLANNTGAGGTGTLLSNNPNEDANGKQANPRRYDPATINDVLTCDQDHDYNDEQKAFDGGAMDKFVTSVGTGTGKSPTGQPCVASDVMNYYDGNTVTALWNYAQNFSMSDNSFGTTFGPSSPGAINLVSGNTGTVDKMINGADTDGDTVPDGKGGHSLVSDAQPYYDDCSTRDAASLSGQNIGDELNAAGLSWGWFQGGFRPTTSFATAAPGQPTSTFTPNQFKGKFAVAPASDQGLCNAFHPVGPAVGGIGGTTSGAPNNYGNKDDYIPHHEPFQYYASTANPHHLAPAGLSAIGTDTQSYVGGTPQFNTANHNYDTSDFDALVAAINAKTLPASALPAVTFLKAPGYEDGHAAYSDPADEQAWLVKEIDALQKTPDWASTVVFINYDDSDGWYDHAYPGVVNPSVSPADALTGAGKCTSARVSAPLANEQGRCGLGPRLPMLVISPWAKTNYVDNDPSDQSSIINFIEYNWRLPAIPGSFDQALASADDAEHVPFDLAGMFDFKHASDAPVFPLDPATGQIDLRGAKLHGLNLRGADLEGAEMTNAELIGVNLQGAFLANANLTGAKLIGVNLNRVIWLNTTCPDGSNSSSHGGTCRGHT